jgi:hypothetical protein
VALALAFVVTLCLPIVFVLAVIISLGGEDLWAGVLLFAMVLLLYAMVPYLGWRAFVSFRPGGVGLAGRALAVLVVVIATGIVADRIMPSARALEQRASDLRKARARAQDEAVQAERRARWHEGLTLFRTPEPGAVGVSADTEISIEFDRSTPDFPPNGIILVLDNNRDPEVTVAAQMRLEADDRRMVLTPAHPLRPGTTYKVGVRSIPEWNPSKPGPVRPSPWLFTTASQPSSEHFGVRPERFRVRVPVKGDAEVFGLPGAIEASGRERWSVYYDSDRIRRLPPEDPITVDEHGGFRGVARPIDLSDSVWAHVLDGTAREVTTFPVGGFVEDDPNTFTIPKDVACFFRTTEDVIVEIEQGTFLTRGAKVSVRTIPSSELDLPALPGLALATSFNLEIDKGVPQRCLSVSVPAPEGIDPQSQVYLVTPKSLPFKPWRFAKLVTLGGIRTISGRSYLSFHPSVQPEPGGGTCEDARRPQVGRARPTECITREGALAPLARSSYKLGVMYERDPSQWTVLFSRSGGGGRSATYDERNPVFVCTVGMIIPVRAGSWPRIITRDDGTGWVLAQHDIVGPIPATTEPYVDISSLR